MLEMEVTSIRFPKAMLRELKTIAHQRSIDEQKNISLGAIIRETLETTLRSQKENLSAGINVQ
jgi:predicted DNA-binding ribbon-helix-helix protein